MIKLSIVIPYYNTYELTLKLLKELQIQVTNEIEVILVDDGCHETRFDQFTFAKIIHLEENGGAPHAWNVGIDAAQGQYIGFIDSDDMIMMNYIDELLAAINTYTEDVILFNFIDLGIRKISSSNMNRFVLGIWKGIYKKNVCPHFREDWKYRSDIPFQRDLRKNNPTFRFIEPVLYVYNANREGSLTWERKHLEKSWQAPKL